MISYAVISNKHKPHFYAAEIGQIIN